MIMLDLKQTVARLRKSGGDMKKFLKWLFILLVTAALGGAGIFFAMGIQTANEFESRASLSSLVEHVQNSADYVPYSQISPTLFDATIAIEDARFERHGGCDVLSLFRAALSQVLPGMQSSGGSTIDMQTVKNLYGQYDGTAIWKAGEIVLAERLDKICSKDEIITLYVNIINYGNGYHGIQAASLGYYGVLPSQLSAAQATLLAGIPQAPSTFNPITHYESAKSKQELVLAAMVRHNMITSEQAAQIYSEDARPLALQAMALLDCSVQTETSDSSLSSLYENFSFCLMQNLTAFAPNDPKAVFFCANACGKDKQIAGCA